MSVFYGTYYETLQGLLVGVRWRLGLYPPPGFAHYLRTLIRFVASSHIVRRPWPCGDGALWEIWAAGVSPTGASAPPGHSAAAVPTGE